MDLFSLKIEKTLIGGLIKYQDVFPDIDTKVKHTDFYNDTHATIYSVLRQCLLQRERIDKVILGSKLESLGVNFRDEISIHDYLDAISYTQVSKEGLRDAADELIRLRVCREICENAEKVKEFIVKNRDKSVNELIAGADGIYNEKIEVISSEDEPLDIYSNLIEVAEKTAQNPQEAGLISPFPIFTSFFGGIRSGNGIYAIAARPKAGKSTYLLNMAEGVALLNEGCKILMLDTEMGSIISQYRALSSMTQINMHKFESGEWKNNKTDEERLYLQRDKIKKLSGRIYHKNVAGKPIDEVLTIARKWFYKCVGRNNPCLIVYDYLKLTGEKLGINWSEYQALGEKINKLNELGITLNAPIFTAIQQNRNGVSKNGESLEDSSLSVSTTDRLEWFCNGLFIFRKKTPEELSNYGTQFGSHIFVPLASRFMGRNSYAENEYVKIKSQKKGEKDKYLRNFINYEVKNFKVSECGTLRNIVASWKDKPELYPEGEHEQGL